MKITKLLLIGLAVIFFACSDDDDPKPTKEGLVGTWTATAIDYAGTTTTSVQGIELKSDFTGKGKDMAMSVIFNDNPATFTSAGSYTVTLTSTTAGQTITQDYPFEGFMINGTWTLDGNTITVTGANGTQKATIVEQTATTLKMKWDYDYTMSQQGATVVMKIKGTYAFKKK
jgi:hypothetical protein